MPHRGDRTTGTAPIRVAIVTPHGNDDARLQGVAGIEIVAAVPSLADALDAPVCGHAAVIVYAGGDDMDETFGVELAELARSVATLLVVPRITTQTTRLAVTARVLGLLARDEVADVTRVVREIAHGRVAYSPDALGILMDLFPRRSPERTALAPSY